MPISKRPSRTRNRRIPMALLTRKQPHQAIPLEARADKR